MTHFFLEFGHSSAVCANRYLQTGDTLNLYSNTKNYWQQYLNFNSKLDSSKKVEFFGIDFNQTSSYLKALKLLLPNSTPPDNIKNDVDFINNANDSSKDCDYILKINSRLKERLKDSKQDFAHYLGKYYKDFERIIMNKGTCNDVKKDRNYNMATNFLSFDNEVNEKIYYGELGMAHTILKNKVVASILNDSPKFKDKVCVINLFCYDCTTQKEKVSNWPLHKIEDDILNYFLPYCTSDFTLFDLSESVELIQKYRAFGQFLIIAKNQN